jgi:hypothetical protein
MEWLIEYTLTSMKRIDFTRIPDPVWIQSPPKDMALKSNVVSTTNNERNLERDIFMGLDLHRHCRSFEERG